MSFHKLLKLADKFDNKYLVSEAQGQAGAQNMSKIVAAVDAMHQISLYLQAIPNPDYTVIRNGQAAVHNFNTYFQGIKENLAPYYDADSRQYTQQYRTQKALPSGTVALLKKQLLEALPWVGAVASIIWFNYQDTNIRSTIDGLARSVGSNADQISVQGI